MAGDDTDASRFHIVEQETKALWAALDMLEARMDRKMDQKMESLTKDIRQMFTEHLGGGTANRHPHQQTLRVFARGRGGGRGDIRRQPSTFEGDFGGTSGEIPAQTPPPPRFNNFEDEGDETPWNMTNPQLDPTHTRPRGNQTRSGKFKLEMAAFDGYLHIEDFLDWLDNVEDYFDCMGVEETMKCRFVAYKFKGGARAWWKQIQASRQLEGLEPITSWPRMKQLLRTRFLPTNFSQTLYLQCLNCKQGSRTIKEYTEEFYRLGARANLVEDESQQVARFIGGLSEELQEKLEMTSV